MIKHAHSKFSWPPPPLPGKAACALERLPWELHLEGVCRVPAGDGEESMGWEDTGPHAMGSQGRAIWE